MSAFYTPVSSSTNQNEARSQCNVARNAMFPVMDQPCGSLMSCQRFSRVLSYLLNSHTILFCISQLPIYFTRRMFYFNSRAVRPLTADPYQGTPTHPVVYTHHHHADLEIASLCLVYQYITTVVRAHACRQTVL